MRLFHVWLDREDLTVHIHIATPLYRIFIVAGLTVILCALLFSGGR